MMPGMGHCGNGPGANSFGQDFYNDGQYFGSALRNDSAHNIERALEAWVETGRKPDRIVAVKYADDDPEKGAAFRRPICSSIFPSRFHRRRSRVSSKMKLGR
jgi:feruloyl esterase